MAQAEKLLTRILAVGAGFTTILVVTGTVTDPVNAPKLLSLGIVAFAGLFVLMFSNLKGVLVGYKAEVLAVSLFMISAINSVVWSQSPLSQSFYGVYGRNNGLLAYLSLSIVLICALTLSSRLGFKSILSALLVAGFVNVIYCLWVVIFGDFIGWNNPYGNILGTLGNPNFIGAFLGIFISVFVAFSVSKNSHRFYRYSATLVIPVTFFEIMESHAVQGRVVAAAGISIVFFYFIRERFSKLMLRLYVTVCMSLGILSLMGALQMGPFTDFIYKRSISLRGQYWLSGWNTGVTNPFSGVGMDSLGDWYRRTRDPHALVLPGVDTVINAAHNVILDMFAFGGIPLLISYLLIIIVTSVSIFKVTRRVKAFDPVFVALVVAWVGYQLQSIISINQIGLAIWGWLISGALIAFEKTTRIKLEEQAIPKRNKTLISKGTQNIHLTMVAIFGALVGVLVGIPPYMADSKWREAQLQQSLPKTEASMLPSFFNPQNTMKYGVNIGTLESSQLFELSHKYALQAVEWNPEVYDLWKSLYFLKNTTTEEKKLALANMKRLDPLNPDLKSLK